MEKKLNRNKNASSGTAKQRKTKFSSSSSKPQPPKPPPQSQSQPQNAKIDPTKSESSIRFTIFRFALKCIQVCVILLLATIIFEIGYYDSTGKDLINAAAAAATASQISKSNAQISSQSICDEKNRNNSSGVADNSQNSNRTKSPIEHVHCFNVHLIRLLSRHCISEHHFEHARTHLDSIVRSVRRRFSALSDPQICVAIFGTYIAALYAFQRLIRHAFRRLLAQ